MLGIALALPALALVLAGAAAAAAERVAVRSATHPGFGRLVFEWPAAVEVESRQSADRLTLRFARPLAADLGAVLGRLGDYLVARAPGADDREVVLQLAPEVRAKVAIHDRRFVVVELSRTVAASAPVELRLGAHDGHARIVLDWAVPISFATAGAERRWRILFDREGRIDAAAIGRRFPDLVDEARMSGGAGRSELPLVLKAGVRPRVFELTGARVVVDLYPPAGAPAQAHVDPTVAPDAIPPDPAPVAPTAAPLPEPAAAPAETASAGALPVPLALQMSASEVERGVALEFAWNRPVAAAFLLRAGHLWSVFAPPVEDPGASVQPPPAFAVPGYLGPGEPVAASGGTALRFPMLRPLAARVERDDARWRVILGAAAQAPQAVRIERLPKPSRLRVVAGEARRQAVPPSLLQSRRHDEGGDEQGERDQDRIGRRLLQAERRAEKGEHHHDPRERGHHHQDRGRQAQHRDQQDQTDQLAGDRAAVAEVDVQALSGGRASREPQRRGAERDAPAAHGRSPPVVAGGSAVVPGQRSSSRLPSCPSSRR